ncbi:unnamed protein product [Owenia fusiformis]|uniref:Uncharacterized protein n=1 Tax=Owenia fusiformis TaxID=6347 RepID=A0A8J1U3S7_OWEFU|nr:unnamed protein product [Owenia fusiformis]
MFTPKVASRAKPSPLFSSRGARSAQNRSRSSILFTPQRRTAYTPKNQSFNRSLQASHVIEETANHSVESYGAPLPVLVTEALTLAERETKTSVHVDPSGWAWLVSGRKLFVWRYKTSSSGKSVLCKQLTLPPSDLDHQAGLVNVVAAQEDHQATSCIAVSAEGIIRYWANITHEGSFVEISADLKGEECVSLTNLQPHGSILATTTSTLVQVVPAPSQNAVTCRTVMAPQGMLAGFGRRMSSFIFGSLPAQSTGALLQTVLAGEVLEDHSQAFYVLSGHVLQKWILLGQAERLVYQCEVQRIFRECLSETIWGQDASHLPGLKLWMLDLQLTRDGVIVLGAGTNTESPEQLIYYATGKLAHSDQIPESFQSFQVSAFTQPYHEDDENMLLDCHLLVPDGTTEATYLYNESVVICPASQAGSQVPDKVDFQMRGDRVLGAGICDKMGLFFSSVHGLVSISSTAKLDQSLNDSSFLYDPVSRPDSALAFTPAQVDELSQSEDKSARLKAAFLHACRGSLAQAQTIVDELFPVSQGMELPSSPLNTMVAALSRELIDDFPASDPRWAETVPHDSGGSSSGSLIILHQLEDKQRAHEYLITFLTNVGLWDKLSTINMRDQPMRAQLLMCEHAEKIVAAITLRNIHSANPGLVDAAIRHVLEGRGDSVPPPGLAPQDLFYREVSRIDDILESLMVVLQETLSTNISPQDTIKMISGVNTILVGMLHDAWQYRQGKAQLNLSNARGPPFIPWTASLGPNGIRALVSKQHNTTCSAGLGSSRDAQTEGELFHQLLTLTDVQLDGYLSQVNTTNPLSGDYPEILAAYESERAKLIAPFLKHGQYERAASLAEKYLDFPSLMEICEKTDTQDRLQRYMVQFQDKGFADFVFKWYRDEGKKGKLLSQPLGSNEQLGQFLRSDENQYLSWLHDIHTSNLYQAHQTLKELALSETESASKKKTLLSLGKLAALASDEPPPSVQDEIEGLNDELELILHQEMLPETVVQGLGMDPEDMRVLPPKELIEVYVSEANCEANEFDFKKALDLLHYVDREEPDYEALRLHVWCQALLRDRQTWEDVQEDDPLEKNRDTIFFKTVELAYTEGMNLQNFLPSPEILLNADELGTLKDNTNFQYLVRAGYEHIERVYTDF